MKEPFCSEQLKSWLSSVWNGVNKYQKNDGWLVPNIVCYTFHIFSLEIDRIFLIYSSFTYHIPQLYSGFLSLLGYLQSSILAWYFPWKFPPSSIGGSPMKTAIAAGPLFCLDPSCLVHPWAARRTNCLDGLFPWEHPVFQNGWLLSD